MQPLFWSGVLRRANLHLSYRQVAKSLEPEKMVRRGCRQPEGHGRGGVKRMGTSQGAEAGTNNVRLWLFMERIGRRTRPNIGQSQNVDGPTNHGQIEFPEKLMAMHKQTARRIADSAEGTAAKVHSFSRTIAKEHGEKAAVLLQYLAHHVSKSKHVHRPSAPAWWFGWDPPGFVQARITRLRGRTSPR